MKIDVHGRRSVCEATARDETISQYQAVLDTHGDKSPLKAYVRLAHAHLEHGAVDDAEAVIKLGLARHPDEQALMIKFADAAYKAKDWDEAVARYAAVLKTHGDMAPCKVYLQLAKAHRAREEDDDAEAVIRNGLDRYPDDLELMTMHAQGANVTLDLGAAVSRHQAVLNTHPDKAPPKVYLRLAHAHLVRGEVDDAEAVLRLGLDRHRDDRRLMAKYADVAHMAKDWARAISRYRAVLNIHGERLPADVYLRLAQALRVMGEADDADATLNKGLELHPNDLLLLTQYPWQRVPREHVTKSAKTLRGTGLSAEDTFALEIECLTRLRKHSEAFPPAHFPRLLAWNSQTREITMEFVGVSLECLSATDFQQTVADLDRQISSIIYAFEQSNVVHLDITSENIVVDKDGIISIIDFGLSVLDNRPADYYTSYLFDEFANAGGYEYQGDRIRNLVLRTCKVR